ncbi:hypothetical protein KR084_012411, partial [Drosophila pseudotakahashii]
MGAANVKPYSEAESKALKKFMRIYKKTHSYMDDEEVQRTGENAWGKLKPSQKKHFEVRPRVIPVKRKPALGKGKPVIKRKKPVCGMRNNPAKNAVRTMRNQAKKKATVRTRKAFPSPVMSSAFINFLREHQKRNANLDVRKRLQKAARIWSRLTKQQRDRFRT